MSETTKPQEPDVIDNETGAVLNKSGAIEVAEPQQLERGIVLSSVQDIDTMALRLAKSALVPRHFREKPADVFLALNMGLELGMMPIASLRSIHVIEGKPSLSADAMVGVIRASGACLSFRCLESGPEKATYETLRRGESDPVRNSYTLAEAKQADLLGKDNWKRHPRSMLKARAKSMLARDVYPDVLHGIYTPDEIEEIANPRTPLDELKERLFEAKTKAEIDAVGQSAFEKLTSAEQDKFRPLYRRHIETLASAEEREREIDKAAK